MLVSAEAATVYHNLRLNAHNLEAGHTSRSLRISMLTRAVSRRPSRKVLYRSAEADALALPGFTFGLDIVLHVGQRRLREHTTVDEIH